LSAAQILLDGLVDYAGLFPPASETMRVAVERYAQYRSGPDRGALGRFIVPVGRLAEFEVEARELMPRGENSEPWRLSVLVGESSPAVTEQMLKFNCHHWPGSADGHAIIDVVELKGTTAEEIDAHHRQVPTFFQRYFEIPLGGNVEALVRAIARVGGRAKVRTGGVTRDAFPPARDILSFLAACAKENVAFSTSFSPPRFCAMGNRNRPSSKCWRTRTDGRSTFQRTPSPGVAIVWTRPACERPGPGLRSRLDRAHSVSPWTS